MERKDNKIIKKIDNLCNDFNVKEQPKDPCDNLRTIKRSIEFIPDLDLDIDCLRKSFIVFKLFNLRIKIFENVFCIVIKNGIYVYSKDLQEAYVF